MTLTRRCANCTRERVLADLFWHKEDREWYCNSPFACEARLEALIRKGCTSDIQRIANRNEDKSGVTCW